jgi:hypothetical protein
MATKSILKTIVIKDERPARRFLSAMENSKGKKSEPIKQSRPYSYANADEIRAMFLNDKT